MRVLVVDEKCKRCGGEGKVVGSLVDLFASDTVCSCIRAVEIEANLPPGLYSGPLPIVEKEVK